MGVFATLSVRNSNADRWTDLFGELAEAALVIRWRPASETNEEGISSSLRVTPKLVSDDLWRAAERTTIRGVEVHLTVEAQADLARITTRPLGLASDGRHVPRDLAGGKVSRWTATDGQPTVT